MADFDPVDALALSPLGDAPIVWIDLAEAGAETRAQRLSRETMAIVCGIDRTGGCPAVDPAAFDLLLTHAATPPAPWVAVRDLDRAAAAITGGVARAPIAASVTAQVLRIGEGLPFAHALQVESLAYSTLLGGAEFRAWLGRRGSRERIPDDTPFVRVEREADSVTITLTRPAARNAICAGMRDALHEALSAVIDDPSLPHVTLRGEGACFSTGGDIAEFGTASDLAQAHAVRTLRSCARLLHDLGARASVMLHGACVGSGIEIPAAAARRVAMPGAFFHLPELAMGLMPGAGGTVSVARAIGRHRACYMMLSGRRIPRDVAAQWGLVEVGA